MNRVVHPFLLAAFPVVFLVDQNSSYVSVRDALIPLGATLAATAVLFIVGSRVLRSPRKAGLLISLAALLFFSYGHVFDVVAGRSVGGMVVGRDLVLVPLWAAIALVGTIAIVRTRRTLGDATRLVNGIGVILLMISLASLGLTLGDGGSSDTARAAAPARLRAEGRRPDIYYLIFDRYGARSSIQEHYGYDNAPFLEALRREGFFVADGSRANYPNTSMSLAASLNLDYLDALGRSLGEPSGSLAPTWEAIQHNEVVHSLKPLGYRYVHIGSWWDPTATGPEADVDIRLDPESEFTRTLYASTALRPLMRKKVIAAAGIDLPPVHRAIALEQFRQLGSEIPALDGPKFVFAHVLMPHPPFVFDRDGRAIDYVEGSDREGDVAHYVDQLIYTNRRILEIVRALLDRPAAQRPIVILQGDEGPHPLPPAEGEPKLPEEWSERPASALREKFPILNAYYLPPGPRPDVYPSITPVNTFRLLFNTYFGTDLAKLPDRSYVPRSVADLYSFVDVTDRIGSPVSPTPP